MGGDQLGVFVLCRAAGITGHDVVVGAVGEADFRVTPAAARKRNPGQPGRPRRRLQLLNPLGTGVGRVEQNEQRLAAHRHVLLVREQGHPVVGRLTPILDALEQERRMVRHQQGELQPAVVPGPQKQVQTGVQTLVGELPRISVPVPAEREETDAVIGSEVDLPFHDLQAQIS
ncbi:MAG: hypothetical protein ABSH20_28760 [Tepidisphaeraceae bacterium]